MPSDNEGDTVSLGDEGDIVPADSNLFGSLIPQGLKLDIDNDDLDYGEDPEMLCGPIIEPAPSQVRPAPPKRKYHIPEGNTGTKGMSSWTRHWSDDHDAYEGPTDNELVPSCSHEGKLLTDPSTASISVDIGRSLDKYLAYEQLNCRFVMHCADCKEKTQNGFIPWVVDSGASVHFTGDKSDFSELKLFTEKERPLAQTVNGAAAIHGTGTVFIKTYVDNTPDKMTTTISRLSLVFYMPGVGVRLLSMGQLLKGSLKIEGNEQIFRFIDVQFGKVKIVAVPRHSFNTIYWVNSKVLSGEELTVHKSMHRDNYDLWHRRLGHPGKQVFEKFESSTRNFPKSIEIPKNLPVCEGCAKGKMHSRSFPENSARATCLFERIHSDLKEFAVLSYHCYKYYISFIDDYASHSWISLLKKKSNSLAATKQFLAMVKNKHQSTVGEWMTDNGGEYVDKNYIKLLKDEGIKIQRSVLAQPQMNGRAERFNRTINEKAESMRHQACLSDSWWEFCVLHANYLYNRTPMRRLDWKTPKGYLEK